MIFHTNHLLADESQEISYLIFLKIRKDVTKMPSIVVIGSLRVDDTQRGVVGMHILQSKH